MQLYLIWRPTGSEYMYVLCPTSISKYEYEIKSDCIIPIAQYPYNIVILLPTTLPTGTQETG